MIGQMQVKVGGRLERELEERYEQGMQRRDKKYCN